MSQELANRLQQVIRQPGKIKDMSAEERRGYNAEVASASQQRKQETHATGAGKHTTDITGDLLADIAIMILASNATGADIFVSGLETYFGDRVGVPMKIKSDCRRGKLRPKIIGKGLGAPAQTG